MNSKIAILKKRLGGAAYLNIPIAAGMFTQIITLPILLANLRPEDFGLYSFVLAIEIWLSIFTIPQISFGAKRGIARGLEGTLLYSYLVRLRLFLIVAVLVWIAALILWQLGGFETLSILLALFGLFFLFGVLTQGTWKQFFIAKKAFHQYAIWRGAALVITPIASLLVAIQTHEVILFAATQFGVSTFISMVAFVYAIRKYRLIESFREGTIDKEIVPYGVRLLPASFAVSTAEKGAALIIGPFFGFANLAVYSVTEKLTTLFKTFLNTSYHLLYVDFARLSWEELVRVIKKHLVFAFSLAVIISIAFAIAGYGYIHFFLPESYQQAKTYLLILALAFPPLALKGIMQAALESNFKSREILIVSIVPNILRLLFFFIAGLLFGIIGILWTMVAGAWIEYMLYYVLIMRPHGVGRFTFPFIDE